MEKKKSDVVNLSDSGFGYGCGYLCEGPEIESVCSDFGFLVDVMSDSRHWIVDWPL
tara:strand:- start:189 stop:356 length:168 start_codon:yes stop_codon:yes gene_type:complete